MLGLQYTNGNERFFEEFLDSRAAASERLTINAVPLLYTTPDLIEGMFAGAALFASDECQDQRLTLILVFLVTPDLVCSATRDIRH